MLSISFIFNIFLCIFHLILGGLCMCACFGRFIFGVWELILWIFIFVSLALSVFLFSRTLMPQCLADFPQINRLYWQTQLFSTVWSTSNYLSLSLSPKPNNTHCTRCIVPRNHKHFYKYSSDNSQCIPFYCSQPAVIRAMFQSRFDFHKKWNFSFFHSGCYNADHRGICDLMVIIFSLNLFPFETLWFVTKITLHFAWTESR